MPFTPRDALTTHIVLVEDNEGFRTLLKDALEIMGYSVFTADCGAKALELLTILSVEPHLILCDFNLVDMTACELFAVLNAAGSRRHIPAIIMTGDTELHKPCAEHASQIDAILVKPFALSHLRATVEKLLPAERSTSKTE
jgi:CheY-like chemotaxis protein